MKFIREPWLTFGIGLGVLVVVELVFQAGFLLRDATIAKVTESTPAHLPDYDDWGHEFFQEQQDATGLRWNSYTYWRRLPHAGKYISVDPNGLRKTVAAGETSNAKRVFFFGGSTMWGTGSRDAFTIPSQVAQQLQQQRLSIDATNFGEMGYVSTQGVIELMLQLRSGNVPDAVVFYDGVNDTLSAFQSGSSGRTINEHNRVREFNLTHPHRRGHLLAAAVQSSLSGLSLARLANGALIRWTEADQRNEDDREQLAKETAEVYLNNMRIVAGLAREYDFEAFSYWQPWIFQKNSLTEYEKQASARDAQFAPLVDAVHCQIEQRIDDLSPHVRFRDISGIFRDEPKTIFIDVCHISERGNTKIAAEIANDLALHLQ